MFTRANPITKTLSLLLFISALNISSAMDGMHRNNPSNWRSEQPILTSKTYNAAIEEYNSTVNDIHYLEEKLSQLSKNDEALQWHLKDLESKLTQEEQNGSPLEQEQSNRHLERTDFSVQRSRSERIEDIKDKIEEIKGLIVEGQRFFLRGQDSIDLLKERLERLRNYF